MTANAEIHFDRVSKWFGGKDADAEPFRAVDGLSLDIARGEMVALLGKTGCGKSTTFNLIAGLMEPSEGAVRVQGLDPFKNFNDLRGKIAVVFQNDRLLPWRSAIGNVELGLEMLNKPAAERREVAQFWLTRLGLAGHEQDYPHALSGGMRQRVSIARAFATDAEHPAVRRAVLLAGRDHGSASARGICRAGARERQDRGLHHPLDQRGAADRRPRDRHDAARARRL